MKEVEAGNLITYLELVVRRLEVIQDRLVSHLIEERSIALDAFNANAIIYRIAGFCNVKANQFVTVCPVLARRDQLLNRLEGFCVLAN